MERENRKVLISVKVSTLLLIFISIIAFVVLTNIIKEKLQTTTTLASNTSCEEALNKEAQQSKRVIKAEVSSRGTITEEPRVSHEENETSVTKEETDEENMSESPLLYGAVGGINFDTVIENSIEEEFIPEETEPTVAIEDVTISKDMDLTIRTGLSREDFITLISGVKEDKKSFFEENAGLIYDICEEYQINEIFFCGLIAGESGWHIADNHRRTHNYISLMSGGGLIKFSSLEDGLRGAAEALHNNYLSEDGKFYYGPTLDGVKTRFCPASSTWTNLIYGNMKAILK